jgi:hypothetical protein
MKEAEEDARRRIEMYKQLAAMQLPSEELEA